jgi:hypothetical protein
MFLPHEYNIFKPFVPKGDYNFVTLYDNWITITETLYWSHRILVWTSSYEDMNPWSPDVFYRRSIYGSVTY